jgi:hypothetical protein
MSSRSDEEMIKEYEAEITKMADCQLSDYDDEDL